MAVCRDSRASSTTQKWLGINTCNFSVYTASGDVLSPLRRGTPLSTRLKCPRFFTEPNLGAIGFSWPPALHRASVTATSCPKSTYIGDLLEWVWKMRISHNQGSPDFVNFLHSGSYLSTSIPLTHTEYLHCSRKLNRHKLFRIFIDVFKGNTNAHWEILINTSLDILLLRLLIRNCMPTSIAIC